MTDRGMGKMKGISCCADCAYYNMKKHKCTRASDEGKPTDHFYADCPLPTVTKCSEWISVKDRLPEGKTNPVTLDFNEVICFCDFGGDLKRTDVRTYKFGTRFGDTRPHFWHGPQIMDGVVTHWQYLPEPPKEETHSGNTRNDRC